MPRDFYTDLPTDEFVDVAQSAIANGDLVTVRIVAREALCRFRQAVAVIQEVTRELDRLEAINNGLTRGIDAAIAESSESADPRRI